VLSNVPTPIPAKISGVFPLEKIRDVGVCRQKKARLIRHEIIFEVFQPV